MKRIANPIQTIELCSYGCGSVAKFINGSMRLMCCKSSNSCPENKNKNSAGLKKAHSEGRKGYTYNKNSNWAKGKTKETNASLASMARKLKERPGTFTGKKHTEETKQKIAKFRTEWLKKSENRKNLGRHKRSWMELTFEQYLLYNNINGWETEVHFWNEELSKNYFPDFIFEDKKLIIELDGTQHRKTVEQDRIRDKWFNEKGYNVVRISHSEFKERHFSGKGFLDLLGC